MGNIFISGCIYVGYEALQGGSVSQFYAFTENEDRQVELDNADRIAPSVD